MMSTYPQLGFTAGPARRPTLIWGLQLDQLVGGEVRDSSSPLKGTKSTARAVSSRLSISPQVEFNQQSGESLCPFCTCSWCHDVVLLGR